MSRRYDAIVIGAGFAGASAAYQLTRRGLRNLLLLEQERTPGEHASGRNASLAFQQLSDGDEGKLAVEGRTFIARPPAGFSDHPLLRTCGSLLLASEARAPGLLRTARAAATLGVESHELTRDDVLRRVPAVEGAEFSAARFTPSDGVVDIRALLRGYLRAATRDGAELRCGAVVTGVDTAGGRVAAVRIAEERVETRLLLDAAGAWAGEIGRLAGVGTRTLAPRRRHMYRARADFPIDAEWPFVWHDDVDVYFRPDAGGLLMSPCDATPHPPRAPEIDPAMQDVLLDKLRRAFPTVARVTFAERWACLRTFTADERFMIGRDPDLEGFVWVAGLGGHGMTTSPAVGRLAAAATLGETTPELDLFTPARFRGMEER